MPTDLDIDLVTRDYTSDGAGGWSESEASLAAVLCQLECVYGADVGNPDAGSRIAELLADNAEPDVIRDEALRALQVLVAASIISDLVVEIDSDELGRPAFVLHYRDRTTGNPVDVAYSPWGGSP